MLLDPYIIAKNITYSSGFKPLIAEMSFVLLQKEFVGLIGGSGSGKTTLLNCLCGIKEVTRGKIFIKNVPLSQKEHIKKLVGIVPQDDIVHQTLTVERAFYYAYLLRIEEAVEDTDIQITIDQILKELDLHEHKTKKIKKLSGGQRKRVNIGLELLHSPEIFFLDEPTAGLDPSLERQLMKHLKALTSNKERLIVMTTHLMQHIEMFDVLMMIHKGYLIYFGPSTAITEYFKVKDMIDLFDKVLPKPPERLRNTYLQSRLYQEFFIPRQQQALAHVI